ncbi:unnamed protein product [Prorocentrum cordatum]|uniref:Uncharacterized protein n=1 Tax=Prorocentrum cordatum TaxID=2364126 RepID=A0ABN9Y0G4_9DINO|nr:unnamed protein product [Polarella glacialis]
MMRRRTSHSVGALLLLLVARGAPNAGSPASGTLARPRLEGSASGRPREPQAEFGRRQATTSAQMLKLLAGDGVAFDQFGVSVAVSSDGARVVVGADYYYADDQGIDFGSAYVLDGTTGERLLKLVASDGAALDHFGYSVAVSSDGARVVVGAIGEEDSSSGSAYVLDGTTGERLLKLVASDGAAGDQFGYSVAVSSDGARVVVGAILDDDQAPDSGSAYVLDGTTGERLLKLVASDGAAGDQFGYSVAVSSDGARVVVGARGDDDQGSSSGSAYVFDGTTGERLLKLVASDGAAEDEFGYSVAVSSDGARVVVGAIFDNDQGTSSGSAYVFDFTEATNETTTKTATTTTDTGTRSAASSTTTIIKTTIEATNESTTATTTKTATTTTDTGTSSAASSTTTIIKTTTETTAETTTATTTFTNFFTFESNTTTTTEPWGLIAVFAVILILF